MNKKGINEVLWLWIILSLDACFLLYSLSQLSISYYEALIYFDANTPLHLIVKASCAIFGQNDWGLRIPFVLLHFINTLLVYNISKKSLKNPIDRIMGISVYIMLPGVNAAALIINEASLVIFISLLFIWLWQNRYFNYSYMLLILSLGIDNSFSIFYISLFFYGLAKKDKFLFTLSLILFSLSMYIYGFNTHGKPRGYFLDTIGVYAATLSPLILLYYIYSLYRIAVKDAKYLLWYICFGAFVFSLLLSLRQRLYLEDFLPFAVIGVPLMVRVFLNSYRVRLPIHRRLHKILLSVVMVSLVLNFLLIHVNKVLYMFYENPQKHFAYKHQVAKELANWLHVNQFKSLHVKSERLAKRLKFYGITDSNKNILKKMNLNERGDDIFKLNFAFKPIARYKVVPFEKENMVKSSRGDLR